MVRFGLICPAATGHLHTMLPLGQELLRRDHAVTLVGFPDAREPTEAAGLAFRAIGESAFPRGEMQRQIAQIGQASGWAALRQTLDWMERAESVRLEQAPAALQATRTEVLIADQICSGSKTIADRLGIPFVTLCSALPLNRDPSVPPMSMHWRYSPTRWAR